ncbi:metal-dependent hydrolase [Halococcoides cellulosivorans]|uniref:Hydrolase n=1 Tax=Halococcoides cellulosivorans TaxID=1679096 RepID=A0A2R4X3H8_9EURY|nr:metal-dependent hydrolase [Halococcoides cellulosivorans]AWB28352.1 hydrolase [Halococcoides cellulosivorans]
MWPWEHAAVGYLAWSLALRALGRRPPTAGEAVVAILATQAPDLIDKPLSWGLGWFPTGYAVGHGAIVALVATVALIALLRRRLAVAAVVGLWSHLLADVAAFRTGRGPDPTRVGWPLVTPTGYETEYGLTRGIVYLRRFGEAAVAEPVGTLGVPAVLGAATLAVWVLDGAPGLAVVRSRLAGLDRR